MPFATQFLWQGKQTDPPYTGTPSARCTRQDTHTRRQLRQSSRHKIRILLLYASDTSAEFFRRKRRLLKSDRCIFNIIVIYFRTARDVAVSDRSDFHFHISESITISCAAFQADSDFPSPLVAHADRKRICDRCIFKSVFRAAYRHTLAYVREPPAPTSEKPSLISGATEPPPIIYIKISAVDSGEASRRLSPQTRPPEYCR